MCLKISAARAAVTVMYVCAMQITQLQKKRWCVISEANCTLPTWRKFRMSTFYMHLPQRKGKKPDLQGTKPAMCLLDCDPWCWLGEAWICHWVLHFFLHPRSTAAIKPLAPVHCGCLQFSGTAFLGRDVDMTCCAGARSDTGAQWAATKTETEERGS